MKNMFIFFLALFVPVISAAQNSCISLGMNNAAANGGSGSPSVASASLIAFSSSAANITSSPAQVGGLSDVYVLNRTDSTFRIISRLTSDQTVGSGETPAISRDGQVLAFRSFSDSLVSGDTNSIGDIFVRDLSAPEFTRVSVSSAGQQANGAPGIPLVSGNGRYVFFPSQASNLVENDTNAIEDLFRHDRNTGQTIRVNLLPGEVQSSAVSTHLGGVSSDGRWAVFEESVNNNESVYLRDLDQLSTVLVAQSGTDSTINADGSSIAYSDGNTELYYIYDRAGGKTKAACPTKDPSAEPLPDGIIGYTPFSSLTDDGRYLAYPAVTASLINGVREKIADLFICDTQTKTMYRPILATDGGRADDTPHNGTLSGDGTLVVYTSAATNLVTTPVNSGFQVYATEIDLCPDDDAKKLPDACGCGSADTDANSNGAADCLDPTKRLKPSKPKISGRGKNTTIELQAFTGTGISYIVTFKNAANGSIIRRTYQAASAKLKNISTGSYKISYIVRLGAIKSRSSAEIVRALALKK